MENPQVFNRFKVISVEKTEREQWIEIEHIPSGELYECHLTGSWRRSKVSEGDIINVKSDRLVGDVYTINHDYGLVTVNPDYLIPVGSISKICIREAWLDGLFKKVFQTFDGPSLIGVIVRDIFQTACKERPEAFSQLEEIRERCFEKENILMKCSNSGPNKDELIKKVDEYLPSIMTWIEKYALQDAGQLDNEKALVQIDTVQDIEESIWSPSLGIQGRVNLSCEVEIYDQKPRRKLVPLTMTTVRLGQRIYFIHEGRSKIYSMMMRERGSQNCDDGLLLFLKNQENHFEPVMDLVKVRHIDEKWALRKRNEIANFLTQEKNNFSGPPFIKREKERSCEYCPQRFNCSLIAKCFEEDKIQESTDFRRKFINSQLDHLEPQEIGFFKEWMESTRNDWKNMDRKSPFWSEPSSLREASNLGLGGLSIQESSEDQVIFIRARGIGKLLRSQDGLLGKRVAISEDEPGNMVPTKVALFFGRVTEVGENEIKIAPKGNFKKPEYGSKSYRLDISDYEDLPFLYYWNLSTLMSKQTPWRGKDFHRLRDCIANTTERNPIDPLKLNIPDGYDLSEQEKCAFRLLDKMRTYRLLNGVTDSDETITNIVNIVKILSLAGKTILLSGHESIVLQKVLLVLKNSGIDFVCFGMKSACEQSIMEHTIQNRMEKERANKRPLDLKELHGTIKIAAATCSVVPYESHLFERNFDFSVILEADKIPLPAILSPLFISERFILTGDSSQVQSAVKSSESRDDFFGKSLFEMLSKKDEHINTPES